MLELPSHQFALVRSLVDQPDYFVLPQAVLAGSNPGRVFVNNLNTPSAAFLWLPCGYGYLMGNASDPNFQQEIHALLLNELLPPMLEGGENGFIMLPTGNFRHESIEVILKDRSPFEIYRRIYSFDANAFAERLAKISAIPDTKSLEKIDPGIIESHPPLQDEIHLTWGSLAAFEAHGYGYCLLEGETLVSFCLAVFADETRDEISVHTAEAYRQQGWGTVVASAFISECLRRGRQPNWECFWDNEPSTKLAEKLGFRMQEDYPVYYWEEE
jgi:RimJ/RimL family protein N-acetyltransferase